MKIDATHWSQLSKLLDAVLDLPAGQREQWLDSLPEDQSELRPTLRELLAKESGVETADLLSKPPDFAAALMAEQAQQVWAVHDFQVNNIIGAYRLLRELGRGGMGAVWLAERVDGKLQRQVALKFPYAGPNQRQLAERLVREREILASLEHPNIARLYDADFTGAGQPFLVLEYVDGVPINQYCDQHKLSIDERLKIFQQVLYAVRYAHAHLVIHRDLKPSNIMVTPDGSAHLLDFGIAKLALDGEAKETALTHISGRALTPDYASPEQLAGESITTASDVYSLGVLLYELMTGVRPYRIARDSRVVLEDAIIAANIILPSRAAIEEHSATDRKASVRQLQKLLSSDLGTLILKALKRNPADRYASVDALLDDVRRYLQNQPILAQPDSQWYRIRKFVNRNRVVVTSVATIALALVIGTGTALWQAHQAKLQRDSAVASAARSAAVTDFMQLMVTEVADADEPITLQQLLTRAEEISSKTYSGDLNQQIAVLNAIGKYYFELQKMELAGQAFEKALALATKSPDHAVTGELKCRFGLVRLQSGDTDTARALIDQGLSTTREYPEVQAECLHAHGYLRLQTNDDARGMIEDIQLAQSKLQIVGTSQPVLAVDLLVSLADAQERSGNSAMAISAYESAAAQLKKLGRGELSLAMTVQAKLAFAEGNIGNPRQALVHLDRAQAIATKRGTKGNEAASFANYRAVQLFALGHYEEALKIYKSAIDYAASNQNTPAVVDAKQGEARVLVAMNRINEAQKSIQEIRLLAASTKLTTSGIYALHMNLLEAMLGMKQQHFKESIEKLSTAIDFLGSRHEAGNTLAYCIEMRGEAYLAMEDLVAAHADAVRAYDIAHKVQGAARYSKSTGAAALLLAKINVRQNDSSATHKWADIALDQLEGSVGTEHPNTIEAKNVLASVSIPR